MIGILEERERESFGMRFLKIEMKYMGGFVLFWFVLVFENEK